MKIYVFGNPLVKDDSLPITLLPALRKSFPQINFIPVDPNENFPPKEEKNLFILDVVKGIAEVVLLDYSDLAHIDKNPISPHDYDLLLHILLLKKMNKLNKIKIIGIPYSCKVNKNTLFQSITDCIEDLLSTASVDNGVL